jgi:leukotriene-A4 hydrolase
MRGSDVAIMDYHNGNVILYDTVLDYGINNSYSSLFPNISLDDPENSFSKVPYEKGSQFLYFIETLIGEDLMPALMKQYLTTLSQMAIGQDDFRRLYEDFVESNFDAAESSSIINRTAWDKWVLEPGMPPVTLNFTSSLLDGAVALASSYLALEEESGPTNYMEYFNFTAAQKSAFVRVLQYAGNRTTVELLERVDNQLALTNSTTNAYVKTQWYQLGIERGYEVVHEPCRKWMGEQGRNAFVPSTCDTAKIWYAEYKMFYNGYVSGNVEKELADCEGGSGETARDEADNETSSVSTLVPSVFAMILIAQATIANFGSL